MEGIRKSPLSVFLLLQLPFFVTLNRFSNFETVFFIHDNRIILPQIKMNWKLIVLETYEFSVTHYSMMTNYSVVFREYAGG